MEWKLESAWQLVYVDGVLAVAEFSHSLEEAQLDSVDQVVVPGRHHECHTDVAHGGTLSGCLAANERRLGLASRVRDPDISLQG